MNISRIFKGVLLYSKTGLRVKPEKGPAQAKAFTLEKQQRFPPNAFFLGTGYFRLFK
jgi:hypothetical protein